MHRHLEHAELLCGQPARVTDHDHAVFVDHHGLTPPNSLIELATFATAATFFRGFLAYGMTFSIGQVSTFTSVAPFQRKIKPIFRPYWLIHNRDRRYPRCLFPPEGPIDAGGRRKCESSRTEAQIDRATMICAIDAYVICNLIAVAVRHPRYRRDHEASAMHAKVRGSWRRCSQRFVVCWIRLRSHEPHARTDNPVVRVRVVMRCQDYQSAWPVA